MTMQNYQPVPPLAQPIKILAVVAHHDDLEFGVAGSIARWVQEGASVTYVIITDGGAGSNDPTVTRADLVARRQQEQIAAAAAVGVTDVHFLGYTDGILQPTLELRREIVRIIRSVKPDRVVCQDPTTVFFNEYYINHPDHRAAGEATIYAVFPSAETRPIFPELLADGYEPHHVKELYLTLTQHPTHFVDITPTIELKMAALRCHVSQIGSGEEAENGALKWIRERNAESEEKTGVPYAEFFKVMNFDRPPAPHDEKRKAEAAEQATSMAESM